MSQEFVPFIHYDFGSKDVQSFDPVPPPIEHTPVAPKYVPSEKAWADLSEALRLGLGPEELDEISSKVTTGPLTASRACPLILRDLGRSPDPEPPPEGKKVPGIVLSRLDDVVQKVTIECTCGESISLDCIY
jgi:hypothetical protein